MKPRITPPPPPEPQCRPSPNRVSYQLLRGELVAYALERLPSGLYRYGTASGAHGDTVIAVALAWAGVTTDCFWEEGAVGLRAHLVVNVAGRAS